MGSTEIDLTPYVQGSDLTADTIILGNGSKKIKTSSKKITTTLGNDDTTLPTSKAVKANIESSVNNAVVNLSTAIAKKQDKITGNYPIDFTGNQISLNVHSYDNYLSSDGSFKNILSLQSGDWLSNVAIFELTDTAFEIYQVDGDTYAMEQYGQIATALQTYFQTNFDNNKQIAQILVLQGSDTVNALIRTKASVKKALAQSLLFKCMYAHINSNDVGFNAIYKADWTFVNDDGYIEELQIYLQVAYDGSEDSQTVILDGITTSKIYQ